MPVKPRPQLQPYRDFTRLMLIRRMKPLGFALEEMAELLRIIDSLEAADAGTAMRFQLPATLWRSSYGCRPAPPPFT
jgi:DNA-binding transcriptional MerR regulator